jgi:Zn-dependent protease with chaperone function
MRRHRCDAQQQPEGDGMTFVRHIWVFVIFAAIAGCASTTEPGAVGVHRRQLLMVPTATVNAQGAQFYEQLSNIAARKSALNRDPVRTERVRGIAAKLIREVGALRADAPGWNWEVNVLESAQINAICLPGGKIAVYSGLITTLDLSDAELAAVLGHEMAHALREHTRERASQAALSNAVVQAVANSRSRYANTNAELTKLGSQLFVQLPFSREMELEADALGLELMSRAGYDPSLAPGLWRKMRAHSGGSSVEFLSTHPDDEKRIAQIESLLQRVSPLYAAAAARKSPRAVATASVEAAVPSADRTIAPTSVALPVARPLEMSLAAPAAPKPVSSTEPVHALPPAPKDSAIAAPVAGADWPIFTTEIWQASRRAYCSNQPIAVSIGRGPGFQTYRISCRDGGWMTLTCERGGCREVT